MVLMKTKSQQDCNNKVSKDSDMVPHMSMEYGGKKVLNLNLSNSKKVFICTQPERRMRD